MHVESILLVALSFSCSAFFTSSRALSHMLRARANSDCAISISLLVSSLTRSAYAFSIAASRICSAACHLSASTYPASNFAASLYARSGGGFNGLTLMDNWRSNEGPSNASVDGRDFCTAESDGQDWVLDVEAAAAAAVGWVVVGRKCNSLWCWSSIVWVDGLLRAMQN